MATGEASFLDTLRHRIDAWLTRIVALAMLAIFIAALAVVHHELESVHLNDVLTQFRQISAGRILAAAGLTVAGYLVLTGYDALALRYVGRSLPYPSIATASFTAYAIGHNLGLAMLTGGSVRLRVYSAAGLSGIEVGQVIAICTFTFGLGVVTVLALACVVEPGEAAAALQVPAAVIRGVGLGLLAVIAAYTAWNTTRREPVVIRGMRLRVPGLPMTLAQLALAAVDLALSASVLYVLLPGDVTIGYPSFLALYVIAMVAAIASHVPGGIGVFEAVILSALPASAAVVGSLLAYRVIYYLLPLALATVVLLAHELTAHRARLGRIATQTVQVISSIAPRALGLLVFVSGVVLLFSGSTPILRSRAPQLEQVVPLAVIELSHLTASVVGLGLVILARALFRRLDAAWYLTLVLLVLGIVASVLKGFDWEEAGLLASSLAVLSVSRREFYRQTSLAHLRFTPGWAAAVGLVIVASVWLGLFSYKHVEYADDLWWHFALAGDAPRFMRASVLVVTLALALGVWRLLRPVPPLLELDGIDAIERAEPIVAASSASEAALALVGDKRLMFADSGDAFIMYGVQGRSWIAMGDPVGPEPRWADLLWSFRELVDRHGGRPAFYQVNGSALPYYLDLGMTAIKLGEEARVPLADFSLQGSRRADLRQLHRRAGRDGAAFELVPAAQVPSLMSDLARISAEWLSDKRTAEKRFSVGYFDPQYLARMPCALVLVAGRPVAFANVWASGGNEELSIDLMRYVNEAPRSVMDYLLVELMLWGRAAGYRYFSLGMAPLAGLEQHPMAPAWHRIGSFVFRHGEHFYNFEGLRQYKSKFDPQWSARYLACAGGFPALRALIDTSVLIAGGLREVVSR